MESSRTSLDSRTSSRTHFEVLGLGLEGQVLGLGLEASRPRKLPCPRLEDSTFFELLKFCRLPEKKFLEGIFTGERLKKFLKTFFWTTLALVSLVLGLGLEHSCPWPQEGLSSEGLSLASDFFLYPWPRASCPRLHLCLLSLSSSTSVFNHWTNNGRINVRLSKNNEVIIISNEKDLDLIKSN